jgi:hypothetical protein
LCMVLLSISVEENYPPMLRLLNYIVQNQIIVLQVPAGYFQHCRWNK